MELNWRTRHAGWMSVTPAIASAWISTHNHHNRFIRETVVDQYARDMDAGQWKDTGEPINFDWNSELINGQHRLLAILQSGKTIPFLVVTGLDPSVRAVVDTHAKRNVRDAFDGAGYGELLGQGSIPKNTAAGMWARMMYGIKGTKGRETRAELLQFANRYPLGGLFALEAFGKHKRVKQIIVAPVLAAVARAYYHFDADQELVRLNHFAEVIATGIQAHAEDRTLILWREVLRGWKGMNSNAQAEIYGKTARTIQAFMGGYPLTKFYIPNEEPFPLPDRSEPGSGSGSTDLLSGMAGNDAARDPRRMGDDSLAPVTSH